MDLGKLQDIKKENIILGKMLHFCTKNKYQEITKIIKFNELTNKNLSIKKIIILNLFKYYSNKQKNPPTSPFVEYYIKEYDKELKKELKTYEKKDLKDLD